MQGVKNDKVCQKVKYGSSYTDLEYPFDPLGHGSGLEGRWRLNGFWLNLRRLAGHSCDSSWLHKRALDMDYGAVDPGNRVKVRTGIRV